MIEMGIDGVKRLVDHCGVRILVGWYVCFVCTGMKMAANPGQVSLRDRAHCWMEGLTGFYEIIHQFGSCVSDVILNSDTPLALRHSGQLLFGLVRVYARKCAYILEECNSGLAVIQKVQRNVYPSLLE